jgi:hypothetical protein
MDRISFEIFKPEKEKFHVTPNLIVFGLWLITIGIFGIFDGVFSADSSFMSYWFGAVFAITLYYSATSFLKYEPLRGTLNGEIIFGNDRIMINQNTFELKNINGLDFGFIDYYGKSGFIRSFNPGLSQGVSNYVSFKYNTGKAYFIYFRIQSKHGSQALYPFINEAVRLRAMSYYRAIDLIDVENVVKPS